MKINSITNILLFVVVFTGCRSKIYTTDVSFCDDVLYAKKNNKVVNGKVYTLNEDGRLMGFQNYVNGISNGPFESWGYYGEIIQKGITKPLEVKNINFLHEGYKRIYLTEFTEGDVSFRYLIISAKPLEPRDTILSTSTKEVLINSLERNTGNAHCDRIIVENILNDEECP